VYARTVAPAREPHAAAHAWFWLAWPRAQNQPRGDTSFAMKTFRTRRAIRHVAGPFTIRTR
jgi:hypothetical protein